MTNLVRTELEAAIAADLPDNTTQDISAADLRAACTDLNDTIFREDAIALSDKTGRIMLQQGGYLLRDGVQPAYETTGTKIGYYSVANNHTELTAGLMAANGQYLSIVFAAKTNNAGGNFNYLQNFDGGGASVIQLIQNGAAGGLGNFNFFRIRNTAVADMTNQGVVISSSISDANRSVWSGYIITLDSVTGNCVFTRNGVDITSSGDGDFDTGTMGLAEVGGSDGYCGNSIAALNGYIDISHIWISREQIDAVNDYSSFFDGDNKPIDLGSDGSTPTGTQPDHFAPDGNLTTNLGSEANWTEVGTLVASSTSPTD